MTNVPMLSQGEFETGMEPELGDDLSKRHCSLLIKFYVERFNDLSLIEQKALFINDNEALFAPHDGHLDTAELFEANQ